LFIFPQKNCESFGFFFPSVESTNIAKFLKNLPKIYITKLKEEKTLRKKWYFQQVFFLLEKRNRQQPRNEVGCNGSLIIS
jgi:hypothetical protein